MRLDAITIPDRARRDLGDIAGLAESIRTLGLLHPIVVTDDGRLVAGQRRLAAASALGWVEVPVTVATTLDSAARLLVAERDENTCRKDMTISEKVELGRRIEEIEKPPAEARQEASRFGGAPGSTPGDPGKVRDKVGDALGMGGMTYERAKQVVDAAETGEPEAVRLRDEMDRTGGIRPAHDQLRQAIREREIPPQPVTPGNGTEYTARQIQVAAAARGRLDQRVYALEVLGRELPQIELHRLIPVTSSDDLAAIARTVDRALRNLRGFHNQLTNRSENA